VCGAISALTIAAMIYSTPHFLDRQSADDRKVDLAADPMGREGGA